MEVHKRRKLNDKRGKPSSSPHKKEEKVKQNENNTKHLKPVVLLVIVGLIGGLVLTLAFPASYSGPRHQHTKKGAEKKAEEKIKNAAATVGDEQETDEHDCEALMNDARHLLKGGRQDGESALDMIASCILKEPNNAAARWNLAAALLQLKRVEEALPFIDEALTLAPDNKQYFLEAGRLFASLSRPKEAVRCLEQYLELLLYAPDWTHLLASISIQREDEWTFLYETDRNILQSLELLLDQYLRDKDSLVKAGYLFKVIIGLKGAENDLELVKKYAFFSFGLCDFSNGMNNLHVLTEHQYVSQGYGSRERAFDIVSTHALRLFTAGLDGFMTSIARNLLINGDNVLNELIYNCDLSEDMQQMDYSNQVRQSVVKQIFVQCILGQNVLSVIIDNGAIVHAENIFGWTPLLQLISLNSTEVIVQILKARADVQSRTPSGMTALHIAAIKGSTEVVLPLTQAGLKTTDQNVLNQTALDIACSHRWYAKEFAKSLNIVQLPTGCPVPIKYVPPLKQVFKSGGWLTPSLKLPIDLSSEFCDIDVLGYTTSVNDVLLEYLILQKPVLIRNATSPTVAKRLFQFWQRNKIVKEYGHITLDEITEPLSEYGTNQTSVTLKQFLDKMKAINEEQSVTGDISSIKPPPYIFQTLSKELPIHEHFETPSVLDPSLTEIIPIKFMLHIGPAFSGISPRFHQSSWNALVFGRRKLFLFPPKHAFYSKQHVWDWWKQNRNEATNEQNRNEATNEQNRNEATNEQNRNEATNEQNRNEATNEQNRNEANIQQKHTGTVLECTQYPGDVLILPDMWGHAAINLRESIGISSEFIYGANEFSL